MLGAHLRQECAVRQSLGTCSLHMSYTRECQALFKLLDKFIKRKKHFNSQFFYYYK